MTALSGLRSILTTSVGSHSSRTKVNHAYHDNRRAIRPVWVLRSVCARTLCMGKVWAANFGSVTVTAKKKLLRKPVKSDVFMLRIYIYIYIFKKRQFYSNYYLRTL